MSVPGIDISIAYSKDLLDKIWKEGLKNLKNEIHSMKFTVAEDCQDFASQILER